jgi:hypothetical protein
MGEADPMTLLIGIVGSIAALILAWRAYRGASAEQEERKREKEERDRRR